MDLLHFLISAAQVLGMRAEDLHALYVKKHAVNQQRQDSGYATKDETDTRDL